MFIFVLGFKSNASDSEFEVLHAGRDMRQVKEIFDGDGGGFAKISLFQCHTEHQKKFFSLPEPTPSKDDGEEEEEESPAEDEVQGTDSPQDAPDDLEGEQGGTPALSPESGKPRKQRLGSLLANPE